MGEHDIDEVEAGHERVRAGAAEVFVRCAAQIVFLIETHGAGGTAEFGAGARLHFDEDNGVAVTGDDIQFAASGALMEVTGDDGETPAAEVAMGQIFAVAAMGLLHRGMAYVVEMAGMIREAIEEGGGRQPAEESGQPLMTSNSKFMTLPRTT